MRGSCRFQFHLPGRYPGSLTRSSSLSSKCMRKASSAFMSQVIISTRVKFFIIFFIDQQITVLCMKLRRTGRSVSIHHGKQSATRPEQLTISWSTPHHLPTNTKSSQHTLTASVLVNSLIFISSFKAIRTWRPLTTNKVDESGHPKHTWTDQKSKFYLPKYFKKNLQRIPSHCPVSLWHEKYRYKHYIPFITHRLKKKDF